MFLHTILPVLLAAPELDRVEKLLEELSNAFGPPGYEQDVRKIMRRELAPLTQSIETDGMGSLIAAVNKDARAPRIMMAAHMDELGLMVRYITPDGFIKFQTLGGWIDAGLISQRWIIQTGNGPVIGVSGLKTPHIMPPEERTRLIPRDRIFIDVGATSKKDAEDRLGIRPGDPIGPDSKFAVMNGTKQYLGKGWDDRAGCAVMIEVMRRLKQQPAPASVYAVATTQEEIGLRGAHTATYQVKPDIGISIEAGVAADYPGISNDEAQEKLGAGAGIFLHDNSMIPTLSFRNFIIETAKEKSIPIQFNVLSGYSEDGSEMQRSFAGIPSVNITVPVRYLHNHNGVIHRKDFDAAVDLIAEVIRKLDQSTISRLKKFD